jgi:hypothetical protein
MRVSFTVTAEMGRGLTPLRIVEENLNSSESTGTWIKIVNLRDESNEKLNTARIKNDIATQFCSFLLANSDRRIMVQDEPVDVRSLVIEEEVEEFKPLGKKGPTATMTHLMLTCAVEQTRFPSQLLFSGKGVTVAHMRTERPPAPQYLGILDCDYLNDIIATDREAVVEMDDGFAKLKELAVLKMNEFGSKRQAQLARGFIERARNESFYPFRDAPADAVGGVEQAVYDVVLEKLNETTNIEAMTKRQQEVVFRLLRRALDVRPSRRTGQQTAGANALKPIEPRKGRQGGKPGPIPCSAGEVETSGRIV